jgi:hypothetical protein
LGDARFGARLTRFSIAAYSAGLGPGDQLVGVFGAFQTCQ